MEVRGCLFLDGRIALEDGLRAWCLTRHWRRAGGLWAVDFDDAGRPDFRRLYAAQGWSPLPVPQEIEDYSTPAVGAPSLYCPWRLSRDGLALDCPGGDAEYPLEWLALLLEGFVIPSGGRLSGEFSAVGLYTAALVDNEIRSLRMEG